MFGQTEAEAPFADTAAKLIEELGGLKRARVAQHASAYRDERAFRRMAEMGWLGAAVAEPQGGANLPIKAIVAILEECGRKLAPEPLVSVMGSTLLLAGCRDDHSTDLLRGSISGMIYCVPVVPLLTSRDELRFRNSGGFVFGTSPPLLDAHGANVFLIAGELEKKFSIFTIASDAPDIAFVSTPTVDGCTLGTLKFEGVPRSSLKIIAMDDEARSLAVKARNYMRLGYAAQLLGLAQEAFLVTLEYLKTRQQFGRPIGSFQALQHRAATLYIEINAARTLLYEACESIGGPHETLAAAAAKAQLSELAMLVVKEAVQMHGAIGYTDEHDISLFLRRAIVLSAAGGDAIECFKEIGESMGELSDIDYFSRT